MDLTPYAILVSAASGALVVLYGLRRQWRIASLRSMLQFATEHEVHSEYWAQTRQKAEKLLDAEEHDIEYWKTQIQEGGPDMPTIRAFLNHYELVAIGIQHGIIDEPFYSEWARTVLVRHWEISADYVDAVRQVTAKQSALREFQDLAEKWGAKTQPSEPTGP